MMTAKRRCAATDDRVYHLAVLRGEMRSMPLDEAAAGYAEDVGHLKGVTTPNVENRTLTIRDLPFEADEVEGTLGALPAMCHAKPMSVVAERYRQ